MSSRHAALAEPLAVALHGITRSGAKPGDRVLVIGAGPIGALSIAALRAMGISDVVAVEPGERRRTLAADLGAKDVWEPGRLERFPPWEPERLAEPSFHVVLECSGKKAAMEAGFYQLARGGTLALVGAGIEGPSFDPNRFVLNELSVCGSFIYDADGFERALSLLARPDFPADLLIESEDVTLDQLSDTLVDLAEGRLAGKVMVVPRRGRGIVVGRWTVSHPYYPTGNPRFNHVAMSLSPDGLDAEHRADLCRFWGEVFGFEELEMLTEDRHRLVFSCVHWDQFMFLIAEEKPMTLPPPGSFRLRGGIGRGVGRPARPDPHLPRQG